MSRYYHPEIETAPVEEIKRIQLERLQEQVKHVYANVPFYRDKMDKAGVKPEDIRELKDIAKLPFNYKQDLRDTYPYGMFAVPLKEVVRLHASSGTTGKQVVAMRTWCMLPTVTVSSPVALVLTVVPEGSVLPLCLCLAVIPSARSTSLKTSALLSSCARLPTLCTLRKS